MFERLREKAGFLDETICRLGEVLQQKHELEEPIGFGPPMNEPFPSLGRICCDSEGRLNANSLLLQGTQDLSRGHALSLDVSQIKEYSIFPGQVVHSTLTNPSGSKLIAHSIVSEVRKTIIVR
jgi:DNA polymerase alpha subunit B